MYTNNFFTRLIHEFFNHIFSIQFISNRLEVLIDMFISMLKQ